MIMIPSGNVTWWSLKHQRPTRGDNYDDDDDDDGDGYQLLLLLKKARQIMTGCFF